MVKRGWNRRKTENGQDSKAQSVSLPSPGVRMPIVETGELFADKLFIIIPEP